MSRLAFLPDTGTVQQLCQRVRGARQVRSERRTGSGYTVTATGLQSALAGQTSRPQPLGRERQQRRPESSIPLPPALSLNAKTLPPTRESLLSEMEQRLESAKTLDRRFSHLVQWLETQADAKAVFVTDSEGLPMAESTARESYLAAAGELGAVIKKLLNVLPDVEGGSTTLQLRGGGNVTLIWCETPLGRFAVGLVLDRQLEPIWSTLIPAALQKVLAYNP
jgi:hypothetical protein